MFGVCFAEAHGEVPVPAVQSDQAADGEGAGGRHHVRGPLLALRGQATQGKNRAHHTREYLFSSRPLILWKIPNLSVGFMGSVFQEELVRAWSL